MSESWKKYLPLTKKKGRTESRQFIVEGVRLCKEALLSDWEIEIAYATEAFRNSEHWSEMAEYLRQRNIPVRVISPQNFKKLCDTQTPQGILLVVNQKYPSIDKINLSKRKFALLLDGIRDPGNMGTIIRTADWFGVDTLLLSPDCVDPFNPKAIRASMGSIFHLPVFEVENLEKTIGALRNNHFFLIGASLTAQRPLHQVKLKKPVALVLGSEAEGIRPEILKKLDLTVRIWKFGEAESLNMAVAGGIFMNHIANQIFPKRF